MLLRCKDFNRNECPYKFYDTKVDESTSSVLLTALFEDNKIGVIQWCYDEECNPKNELVMLYSYCWKEPLRPLNKEGQNSKKTLQIKLQKNFIVVLLENDITILDYIKGILCSQT